MSTTNSSGSDLGSDVQIIREILFGDQAKYFQQRIEALETETSSLKEENRQLRKALADESKARQRDNAASEERLKALIAELAKQLEDNNQSQKGAQNELRSNTEARFQQYEAARSSDLKQQNELIASLLAALKSYKQHTISD